MALNSIAQVCDAQNISMVMPNVQKLLMNSKDTNIIQKILIVLPRFGIHPDPSAFIDRNIDLIGAAVMLPHCTNDILLSVLARVRENRFPKGYTYNNMTAPWITCRVLSQLQHGHYDLVKTYIEELNAPDNSPFHYGILYECAKVAQDASPAVTLLSHPDWTIKYMGLRLAELFATEIGVFRTHLLNCLASSDAYVRTIVYSILSRFVNEGNRQFITDTFLQYFHQSEISSPERDHLRSLLLPLLRSEDVETFWKIADSETKGVWDAARMFLSIESMKYLIDRELDTVWRMELLTWMLSNMMFAYTELPIREKLQTIYKATEDIRQRSICINAWYSMGFTGPVCSDTPKFWLKQQIQLCELLRMYPPLKDGQHMKPDRLGNDTVTPQSSLSVSLPMDFVPIPQKTDSAELLPKFSASILALCAKAKQYKSREEKYYSQVKAEETSELVPDNKDTMTIPPERPIERKWGKSGYTPNRSRVATSTPTQVPNQPEEDAASRMKREFENALFAGTK